jgi:4-amino-4-deoxy-L-arabinose transferase-like glycosyltransferase
MRRAIGVTALSRPGGRGVAFLLAAGICTFLVLIDLFWVGFLGSDDSLYWAGSGGWLTHIPWLGATHWGLRHTLVIPMAIARAVLGDGPLALLLPSLLYSIGVLVLVALWINRTAGLPAAAAALALVVTNPQFVMLSSIANIDIAECFFILVALALIHRALDQQTQRSSRRIQVLLLLAGISCGLGMLSRETSAFAMAAIGLLFLAGYGTSRVNFLFTAAGFAAVVGLEFAYDWWMSGDFFYRLTVSLHHDTTIDRHLDQGASVPLLHPAIDPLTMLLFNHNFGLLAWIGMPLTVWLIKRGDLTGQARRLVMLAIMVGLTWTILAAAAWTVLNLAPRYFLLPSLLLSMLSGMALANLRRRGARRLVVALSALLIGANLLSASIDYRNTAMYGERVLVDIATRDPGLIHTDTDTLARAGLLLRWRGVAERVTDAPPGPGDLFFFNPGRATEPPGRGWAVVERYGLGPSIGQSVAAHLLPAGTLSPAQWTRLGRGHPDVTLYRLP